MHRRHRLAFFLTVSLYCQLALAQSAPPPAAAPAAPAAPDPAVVALQTGQDLFKQKKYLLATFELEKYVALKPTDAAALTLLGQAYLQVKKPKQAVPHLTAAAAADPKNVDAWRGLAEAQEKLKSPIEAAKAYDQVARLSKNRDAGLKAATLFAANKRPKDAVAALQYVQKQKDLTLPEQKMMAAAAVAAKDDDAAIAAYKALITGEPEVVTHRVALGLALASKSPDEARTVLDEVLKRDPKQPDALDASAKLAETRHDDATLIALLTTLTTVSPKHPSAQRRLGLALVRTNKKDEGRKHLEAQLAVAPDAETELALATLDRGDKKLPAALEHTKKAAKLDPKSNDAIAMMGDVQLEMGDAKGAAATLAKLAESKDASADALFTYGRAALLTQQAPKAKTAFTRIVTMKDARGHEGLGDVYASTGDFKKAAESYGKNLAAHDKDASYLLKTALAQLKSGNGGKAEELLGKVLVLEPNNQEASRYLGRAKLEKGEIAEAIKLLETALQKFPDDADVNFAYGKAQYLNKTYDKAMAPLQKALAKEPQHPEANALMGLLLMRNKDDAGAEKHLSIAVKSLENFDALLALGTIRFRNNDIKSAEELVHRAIKLQPQDDAAMTLSTRVNFATKHYDVAEKMAGAYLFRKADDVPMLLLGAEIAAARNDLKNVIGRFEAAQKTAPLSAADGVLYADAQVRSGKYKEGLQASQAAIAAGADTGRIYSLQAYAQFKTGDKDGSRKSMATAVQKGADDAYVHLIRGEELLGKKDKNGAKTEIKKALTQEPNNETANALMGDIARASGDNKGAVGFYRKSLAINAAQPVTHANLVRALLDDGQGAPAQREMSKLDTSTLAKDEAETLKGRVQNATGNYKKAKEYFEAAVAANPNNFEATYAQAENYLKLPHYEKAIALMEAAQKLDPSRAESASRLAELYAEVGDQKKAAQAMDQVSKIEDSAVEQRRKELPPEKIKTVAVGRFGNMTKDPNSDWIGVGLAESMTADLSKMASLKVVERSQIEQVKNQLAERVANEDNIDPKLAAEFGKMVAAQWLLVGSYQVTGDSVRINARLVDVGTSKIERSASQSGGLSDLTTLQKKLALELAGELGEATDDELRRIGRAPSGNVESYRLASEAKLLEYQGDVRAAQARFREAVQADAGNMVALQGLQKSQQDLGTRNTVAIMDFKAIGDAPTWIGAGLTEHLASKLSKVSGIQIVERGQIDRVKEEVAFSYENEDMMDAEKLPAMGKALAAGCVLVGSYQQAGEKIQLNARLVDIASNKDLVGERVMGSKNDLLELQDQLAKKIVYALIGAPSEEELEALKSKQSLADYQKQMQDLDKQLADRRAKVAAGEKVEEKYPTVIEEKKPDEVAEAPEEPAHEDYRSGLDLRLSRGASGWVPSLLMSVAEVATQYGAVGFIVGWNGDNMFGGRPIDHAGDAGSAHTFGLELGAKMGRHIIHKGGFDLGVGAAVTMGWDQYLAADGSLTDPNNSLNSGNSAGSAALNSDFVVNIRPMATASLKPFDAVTLIGGVGWNFQMFNQKPVSGTGMFVDVGARISMDEGRRVRDNMQLGYRLSLLVPGDQSTATAFIGEHGRGLMVHGLTLAWGDGDTHGAHGLYGGYCNFSHTSGEGSLSYTEGAYEYTWRGVYDHRPFVNPLLRGRVGWASISGVQTNGATKQDGKAAFTMGGAVGAELAPLNWLLVPIAIGHDFILSDAEMKLSGYVLNVGATLIF